MVTIRPRSDWTSTPPGGHLRRSANDVTHFIIHWPGMGRTVGATLTEAQIIALLNSWRNQHIRNGWGDNGYNFAIDQTGTIWEIRGAERTGAQARNFNTPSIGVVLIIGEGEKPSAAMVSSVHALRTHLRGTYVRMVHMMGHREAPGQATACPGPLAMAVINGTTPAAPVPAPAATAPAARTVEQMAREVLAGQHGNGHAARQRSLGVTGAVYAQVRAEVNRLAAGGSPRPTPAAPAAPVRSIAQMATEVIAGRHGTGHAARQRSLGVSDAVYAQVRAEVNRRLR